jgi:MoxR-like ATPase
MTYHLRPSDDLFLRVLSQPRRNGVRAGLISGAPGVGKTALGRHFADQLGGTLEYYLCHHWTSEEDLFVRVDPARVAAIAGGVEGVQLGDAYRPGVLLRAVLSSHDKPTVVLIDELDKAPERVDALLLEFLQTGRVYGHFGEVWEANLDQLFVIITNNGVRPISEPLLRRVFRYEMPHLPASVEADIIRHQTGAAVGVCRLIVQMMAAIRQRGQSSPSLQEGIRLAESLSLASSSDEVELLLRGWLCKTDADWDALVDLCGDQPASVLFGEVKRNGV